MKNEDRLRIEHIFPNPFLVGEIIFLASKQPKPPTFKIELSDEQKLQRVREELKQIGKR